uniref:Uncharacterized protein n=1 Tax=Leptocylindrus danicus TaxID=163516 RepID=A0A7S2PR38_9STRA
MEQGTLALNMISAGTENSLTSVIDSGSKKVMISTPLISVFFIDDSLDVVAGGVAILRFGNTNRRSLARIGSPSSDVVRDLQVDYDGEGAFSLTVELRGSGGGENNEKAADQFDASAGYGMANVFVPIVFALSAFTAGVM